jgi:hypothetical protein
MDFLPTLLDILHLQTGLNQNLSPEILKEYTLLFLETKKFLKNDFSLKGDRGIEISVRSILKLALLNLKKFDVLLQEFQEISEVATLIYDELTKNKKYASKNTLIEKSLNSMVGLYDLISDDKMYSDDSLKSLEYRCIQISKELESSIVVISGENLSSFFKKSARAIKDLNLTLNSVDDRKPGIFMVSYQAMEMLDDLRS